MTSKAVVLSNLGSPASPSVDDVRTYLDQFLMDPRVLDIPWALRRFVVSAMILPRRPRESAHAYASIWTDDGSPLVATGQRVTDNVRARLDVPVSLGMRYGEPSIRNAIRNVAGQAGGHLDELVFVPLYPHYAMSTVETGVVEVEAVLRREFPGTRLTVQPPYFDQPRYISALVDSAAPFLSGGCDHLLFSYHGLPERHLRKTDPTRSHCLTHPQCCSVPSSAYRTCYRAQVFRTTEAFLERSGFPAGRASIAFQSRLGRDKWLEPFTDGEIVRLAHEGVKHLCVICPAFVADCLETLEEMGIRGKERFLAEGGERFTLIPCLNENSAWLDTLVAWCNDLLLRGAAEA